jgi:hypothetical protein
MPRYLECYRNQQSVYKDSLPSYSDSSSSNSLCSTVAFLLSLAWLLTADNNLTLYGFCRFKTTQLLNLWFLENEIADKDHTTYQAGLSLGLSPSPGDRLGLQHNKRDADIRKVNDVITGEFTSKLRDLIKEYSVCW